MIKRPSQLLQEITQAPDAGEITMGRFVELLGDRSFILLILILALPNALPIPGIPGLSTITGVPICIMAAQMVRGKKAVWLPHRIANKRFQHKRLMLIIAKCSPFILWLEKFLRPRLTALCESSGEKVIGVLIVILAGVLALPIAGTNFLMGFPIALLALALLEEDGLLALIGILFTLFSVGVLVWLAITLGDGAMEWLTLST